MMIMTGQFRFALIPSADEQAFVDHMQNNVFKNPNALQLTRITRSFNHALMKGPAPGQYIWQATVDLQTDAGYDFPTNASQVQGMVKKYAVLIGVDVFTNVD